MIMTLWMGPADGGEGPFQCLHIYVQRCILDSVCAWCLYIIQYLQDTLLQGHMWGCLQKSHEEVARHQAGVLMMCMYVCMCACVRWYILINGID